VPIARPAAPEGAFAVVMATAIVARAVHATAPSVARGLAWASVAELAAVAVLLALSRRRGRAWWDVATFTAAAAATGAALGADGWRTAAIVLAMAAVAGCGCLLPLRAPWRAGADGAGPSGRRLLAVVSTQSAVIAAASLARQSDTTAIAGFTVAVWLGAIAVYAAMIPAVVRGMAARAGERAFAADDWIAMGALAISALAAAELLRMPGVPVHPAVRAAGVAAWGAAWLWVPSLIRLDARALASGRRRWPGAERWSMVFPVGMLCAASQALGAAGSLPALVRLGRDAGWIALAVWAVVAAGVLAGQGSRRYVSGGRRSRRSRRSEAASGPSPALDARAAASSRSSSARPG
jgi:voltage-gated anion channel